MEKAMRARPFHLEISFYYFLQDTKKYKSFTVFIAHQKGVISELGYLSLNSFMPSKLPCSLEITFARSLATFTGFLES